MYYVSMSDQKIDYRCEIVNVSLSEAVDEFLAARSLALSPHTIGDYRLTLSRLETHFPTDVIVSSITHRDIRRFLPTIPGSQKNKLNAYIGLSAFWTWLITEGYAPEHILRRVDIPKPPQKEVSPIPYEDIVKLFAACRENPDLQKRDECLILLLLDTGVRVSELCSANVGDLSEGMLSVMGKGSRQRRVPVSEDTVRAVDEYLETRKVTGLSPLLHSEYSPRAHLTRDGIRIRLADLATLAGVVNIHPHRFRHTFAINYLRNGGDAYTLQAILGHTTTEMTRHYLHIVESDLLTRHNFASPVKKWGLANHGSHP